MEALRQLLWIVCATLFCLAGIASNSGAAAATPSAPSAYDAPVHSSVVTFGGRLVGPGAQAITEPTVTAANGRRLVHPAKIVAANGGEDVLRHYTTREAAEAITKGGSIEPGAQSGKIWLTPDRYASGAEARAKLALNKTPDGYFEIPTCRVTCPSAPGRVEPYYGQPGGGTEITTEFPIDIRGLIFRSFE